MQEEPVDTEYQYVQNAKIIRAAGIGGLVAGAVTAGTIFVLPTVDPTFVASNLLYACGVLMMVVMSAFFIWSRYVWRECRAWIGLRDQLTDGS